MQISALNRIPIPAVYRRLVMLITITTAATATTTTASTRGISTDFVVIDDLLL